MTVNIRQALLDLAVDIGRHVRPVDPLTYPQALDYIADLEDRVSALASLLPERSTLSESPNGYLPSRHPLRLAAQVEDFIDD